ncbi:MAG: pyruvate, phosphate dikinase [Leptospiraceae bacterium]|nr:pyruvate, phosphate dikinase [Leptospiraceae bacterium]
MAEIKKYVYSFGDGKAEGDADMRNTLGGKGANLCEMNRLGLPVPPGFVIATEVCVHFYQNEWTYPFNLREQVQSAMKHVEIITNKIFGDSQNPLLVSVRSGARTSMPGMMDTILNLGLNDTTVQGLAAMTGDERFAWDSYRRFIHMYSDVVLGLKTGDLDPFEEILEKVKTTNGRKTDFELTASELKQVVSEFKDLVKRKSGKSFPESPEEQLWGAVGAVFRSWMNDRAKEYRRMYQIPEEWGTAVNVMAMVYGNMADRSGTGVAFTRNPASGENALYGEYLMNAQGEDVVAGVRTPHPIAHLKDEMPENFAELERIAAILENHYKDMQDVEFTIEQGKLWMLQTRSGKRTGRAALRIAIEQVTEGLINEKDAIRRLDPDTLNQLLQPTFDESNKDQAVADGRRLTAGLPAGPGAAAGKIALSTEAVEAYVAQGHTAILTRLETSPDDIRGMKSAVGILTARGGMTSHAALIARQMGKVCVVGCEEIEVDYSAKQIRIGSITLSEGDEISIDGFTGEVLQGLINTKPSSVIRKYLHGEDVQGSKSLELYDHIMQWADRFRDLRVYTNADLPEQCEQAIAFGAEGVGLCRTEHMFFGEDRIQVVRSMILAPDAKKRREPLAKLLAMQRDDFAGIFRAMDGKAVTIRCIDPPLHEFLPHDAAEIEGIVIELGLTTTAVQHQIDEYKEFNPMLGMRGCRLGIMFPEIIEMQIQAMMEAACIVQKEGKQVVLHVMIPLVSHVYELNHQKAIVDEVAERVFKNEGCSEVEYLVGTMIEIPRACITADAVAKTAEFFSFGTNDLTQTTYGLSRDDSGKFLPHYINNGIYPANPFASIDEHGVGQLMQMAVERGRSTRPGLEIGICGEQGGDPHSIYFCHKLKLDYVSCSPFRVPVARLAAAKAALDSQ